MVYAFLPSRSPLDAAIQRLQFMLHEELCEVWQLGDDGYQSYGRAYKLPVPGQTNVYRPAAYLNDGEHRILFLDDRYTVTSFFGVGDSTTVDTASNLIPVHIVFFVNLERISSVPGRYDIEAREQVQAILDQDLFGFTLNSIATKLEVVLAEYSLSRAAGMEATTMKYADVHPYHAFRVNGTIRYSKPQLT